MTDDHPDLLALRAAVLAAPADDVPRLAYADRLEELDEPERAEFIRLQCEILSAYRHRPGHNAGMSTGMRDPMRVWRERVAALRERERELLGNHGEQWAKDALGDHYRPFLHGGGRVEFHRGFVAHVTCPLAAWLGERCGRCNGRGAEIVPSKDGRHYHCSPCTTCCGTGYVGGIAGKVCGSQPVEAVTLSDREPQHDTFVGPPRCGWVRGRSGYDYPHILPPELWDRLTGSEELPATRSAGLKIYPTRPAALDALSAAALSVAREWAKLGKSRASETRELRQ